MCCVPLIPCLSDGLLLAEVDRVLRPGGFWVLTGPPYDPRRSPHGLWHRTAEDLQKERDTLEAAAARLCWKKFSVKGMFAIWQKPLDGTCVKDRDKDVQPPICPEEQNPDFAWWVAEDLKAH